MTTRRQHPFAPASDRNPAIARFAVLAAVMSLALSAGAQGIPADGGIASQAEALARAQRAADRVKEFIVMSGKAGIAPASVPAPAPAPASVARIAARSAPHGHSSAPRSASAASQVASAAQPTTARPSLEAAGADTPPVASPAPAAPRPLAEGAQLFDFENSTEGFTLHSLAEWSELPAVNLTLTRRAVHGQFALQATSSTDAWLGVDLTESVDFSALRHITFWMRSAGGAAGRLAIKSGSQLDWCELRPTALRSADGFVRYEVALQTKGRDCRNLDLEDVRGLHWFVRAGDTVSLDDVELR